MLTIAAAQTPGTRLDDWRQTRELVAEMVARAADQHADVVLLPECVWPAYFLGSIDEYFLARQAGMPGDDTFVEQLRQLGRAHHIAICAGHVAEHGRRLSNAVTLIDSTGEILGTRRKCFLWDFDNTLFEPGSEIAPVDTPWGLIGLMICADARLPEIPATLAARGARLILQPTAWVNVGTPEKLWNPQPALLIPERAREFGVPVASASKWDVEGSTTFVGSSLICDASGDVLAQCGTSESDLIVAEVSPRTPRRPRLTPDQRTRLLSSEPATPVSAQVPLLSVAAVESHSDVDATLGALASTDASPTLLVVDDPGAGVQHGNGWLLLSGPTTSTQQLAGVQIAGVRDRDADGFAPIRAPALAGVHLVVVFGEDVSENTLRSRAAENRIFLVRVTRSEISAYDPRGGEGRRIGIRGRTSPKAMVESSVLTLDVAQAADREFAPRTNPFTGRRPECYEF
jgi:predicted amidohydrolase